MEITGKLIAIMEANQVSESFTKREFVVEYAENPQYPELIKLEMIQDKCTLLDGVQVGQEVKVSYNLKGRKWTSPEKGDMYFNTLQGWKVEAVGGQAAPSTEAPAVGQVPPSTPTGSDTVDDLPF